METAYLNATVGLGSSFLSDGQVIANASRFDLLGVLGKMRVITSEDGRSLEQLSELELKELLARYGAEM